MRSAAALCMIIVQKKWRKKKKMPCLALCLPPGWNFSVKRTLTHGSNQQTITEYIKLFQFLMHNRSLTNPVYPCAGRGGLRGSLGQNWTSRTPGTSRKARSRRPAWNPRPCRKSRLAEKQINKQKKTTTGKNIYMRTHRPTALIHDNRLHEIINRSILPPALLSLVYFKALFFSPSSRSGY